MRILRMLSFTLSFAKQFADNPCHLCHFGHFGIFLAGMYLMHRRCHDDPRDAMLRHFVLVTATKGRDQVALDAARRTCLLKFFYNTFFSSVL